MGMDKIELFPPEETVDFQERYEVLDRRGTPDELRDLGHFNLSL
jgi:hypothetical protein